MNIRQTSLATSLLMAFLFVGVVAYELLVLRQEKLQQLMIGRIVETGSILSRGTIELSLERSVMQVTLNLPDPIAPAFRDLIEQQRRLFADHVGRTRQALDGLAIDPATAADVTARLDEAERTIGAIRRAADAQLDLPRERRDPAAIEALPAALKKAIIDVTVVPALMLGEATSLSSRLATLLDVQAEAWAVREFGGQDRTYLAIATATGEPIAAARRGEMAQLHDRARTAMTRLSALAAEDDFPAELRAQVRGIEEVYFGSYAATRDALLAHDIATGPYPMAFEDFFGQSTAALDDAVALSVAAGEMTVRFVDEYGTAMWTRFAAFGGMLALALAICGVQLYNSQVHVSGRLGALAATMRRLAAGDTGV